MPCDRRASLTKNREGKCDPEMHKAIERQPLALRHEGQHRRDTATGLLRCLIGTVANLADVTQVDKLLHELIRRSAQSRLQPALKRQDMSDVLYKSDSNRCSAFNVSLCNVLLVESIRMNSS